MIAYYAWTDTQLINCVNLKVNQHAGEDGVLFVLKLERISDALLDVIIKDKCFVDIKVVPCKYAVNSRNAIARTLKIDTVLEQKRLRQHYRICFANAVGVTVYSRLVTAGFWAETSFLIERLVMNNKGLKIDFVEEGLRHEYELFYYTLSKKPFVKIMRWFYDGRMINRWKRRCEFAYFYSPERFDGEEKPDCYTYASLIPIDEHNHRVKKVLIDAVVDIDITEYQNRSVILLEDLYEVDFDLLVKRVAEVVGPSELIVKMHPFGTGTRKKLPEVYYDERRYIFEGVLIQLKLDEKTIIRGISSIINSVNYMLKKKCRIKTIQGYGELMGLKSENGTNSV